MPMIDELEVWMVLLSVVVVAIIADIVRSSVAAQEPKMVFLGSIRDLGSNRGKKAVI